MLMDNIETGIDMSTWTLFVIKRNSTFNSTVAAMKIAIYVYIYLYNMMGMFKMLLIFFKQ